MDSIFSGFSAIDDDFYEEIEETLIMGDMGIQTTMSIVEDLKEKVKEQHIKDPSECKALLIESIKKQMDLGENAYEFENRKSVVLVIGVNGVGKTTSVGKLAGQLKEEGKEGDSGGGRYVPGRCHRAADGVGGTGPAWISSPSRKVPIRRRWSMTRSRRPNPEMRTC